MVGAVALQRRYTIHSDDEITTGLSAVFEVGYTSYLNESTAFSANKALDEQHLRSFIDRLQQFVMLFWGYDSVMHGLKITDTALSNRLSQMRSTLTAQIQQLQTSLIEYQTKQIRLSYGPPNNSQNAATQIDDYRRQTSQELAIRAQQICNYNTRLFVLTQQQGVPMAAAKLIAEAETGYHE